MTKHAPKSPRRTTTTTRFAALILLCLSRQAAGNAGTSSYAFSTVLDDNDESAYAPDWQLPFFTATSEPRPTRPKLFYRYNFAMVPKSLDNPFFASVEEGCRDMAEQLSNDDNNNVHVQCYYTGPPTSDLTGVLQGEIVQDILSNHISNNGAIHGLAISVQSAEVIDPLIQVAAVDLGIPVVTFDSDSPNSQRRYYVGTNNTFLGEQLATLLKQLRPGGGRTTTFGLIHGGTADPNLVDRANGFLQALQKNKDDHYHQLAPNVGDAQGNVSRAIDEMERFVSMGADAIVSLMGLPMRELALDETTTYSPWRDFVTRHRASNLTLVCGDAMDHQKQLLERGYVHGLVGQLPYEMGTKSVETLFSMVHAQDEAFTMTTARDPGTDTSQQEIKSNPNDYYKGTNVVSHLNVPFDLTDPQVNYNVLGRLKYMGFAMFGIVAATSLACSLWTVLNRNVRVVRVSQPMFLLMIALGVLMISTCMVPFGLADDPSGLCSMKEVYPLAAPCTRYCMSIPWAGTLGFTTAISAIYAKARRLNKFFRSRSAFTRLKVSNREFLMLFSLLALANIAVLLCWSIIDPLIYIRVSETGTENWNRVITTQGACRSRNAHHFLLPLALMNGGVLLLTNWRAYEARHLEDEFGETKYSAFAMASVLHAIITALPVLYLVRDNTKAFYVVFVCGIFIICMVTLLAIFAPKMFAEEFRRKSKAPQRVVLMSANQTGSSPTSNGPDSNCGSPTWRRSRSNNQGQTKRTRKEYWDFPSCQSAVDDGGNDVSRGRGLAVYSTVIVREVDGVVIRDGSGHYEYVNHVHPSSKGASRVFRPSTTRSSFRRDGINLDFIQDEQEIDTSSSAEPKTFVEGEGIDGSGQQSDEIKQQDSDCYIEDDEEAGDVAKSSSDD